MPQLDLSTYASQAFWMVLCFSLLWLLLSIFITPKIADVLEQRKRKIDDYIRKAEKLNQQAKASLEKYEQTLNEAKAKAAADIAANQKESAAFLAEEERLLNERLNKQIADSEFKLAKEKKETMQQIQNLSQNLAFDIVQKLGFAQITENDVEAVAAQKGN
ncbi:MAG: hypothetical protein MSB80_02760 [Alphaproteobacteria bacterium]|nr:hypothetical protein [Alphaproteobacteria bacterium]